MKRRGFSFCSMLCTLAFLIFLLGALFFFVRSARTSSSSTFKSVSPRIETSPPVVDKAKDFTPFKDKKDK